MEGLEVVWTGHLSLSGHTRNVHIFKSMEQAGMKRTLPLCASLCCFKAEVRIQLCLPLFLSILRKAFKPQIASLFKLCLANQYLVTEL